MKRGTLDKLKDIVSAGQRLQKYIDDERRKSDPSKLLIADLEKLHGSYMKLVYETNAEELLSTGKSKTVKATKE